jgi:phosphoribosylamine---glycine ligase
VKADGLAAGKGVIIAQTRAEAEQALSSMMRDRAFGTAGEQVVIEEFLSGREMSFFVFTDGDAIRPLVPACDYKRVYDGNKGPNTGGMGSYSPPEFFSSALGQEVVEKIMRPTIKALSEEDSAFTGILYGGLMITGRGPMVIEFNARLGDPETQVVLPRLKTDLVEIVQAVIGHALAKQEISWSDDPCVGVVLTSGGYPGHYQTGLPISGLDEVDKDVMVFHAGTRLGPAGEVLTAGGRVLTVVARGKTMTQAREKVYDNAARVSFKDAHYRRDIALTK